MSESSICRLCLEICSKYKSLYHGNGQANQIYEMTYKYLHPTILNLDQAKHLTVVCVQCWRRIRDFHNFKLSILVAQAALNEDIKEVVIKTEDEEFSDAVGDPCTSTTQFNLSTVKSEEPQTNVVPIEENIMVKDEKEFISLPELELIDVQGDHQDSLSMNKDVEHIKTSLNTEEEMSFVVMPELEGTTEPCNQDPSPITRESSARRRRNLGPRKARLKKLDDLIAAWKNNITCGACSKPFVKYTLLRQHFAKHHPNMNFHASCCKRKLFHLRVIEDHFRLHNDQNSFTCGVCQKSFFTEQALNRHLTLHYVKIQKPTNVCKICDKTFATKVAQCKHQCHYISLRPKGEVQADGRTVYPCYECGDLTHSERAFRHHRQYCHKMQTGFICSFCSKSFKSLPNLRAHALTHKPKVIYSCPFCPRMFTHLPVLSLHQKQAHGQAGDANQNENENPKEERKI